MALCSCCRKLAAPTPETQLPVTWFLVTIQGQDWHDADGYPVCPDCIKPIETILRGEKE